MVNSLKLYVISLKEKIDKLDYAFSKVKMITYISWTKYVNTTIKKEVCS